MARDTPARDHSKHASSTTLDTKEKATDQFAKIADKTTSKFSDIADGAEGIAHRVAEQGREASERVQQVAGNLKGALDRSVKNQPIATLAVAVVMGFVLGALWKA